ncbi:MAG: hypothetical protein EBU96_05160, partial [Actinobacteria bacterium]|nr:hypothetical protein [Actinomycetota bacterium]
TFKVREVLATDVAPAPRQDEVIVRKPAKLQSADVVIERMEQPTEPAKSGGWRDVVMRFGSKKGATLGDIEANDLRYLKWLSSTFEPGLKKDGSPWPEDVKLRTALDEFKKESSEEKPVRAHYSPPGCDDIPF